MAVPMPTYPTAPCPLCGTFNVTPAEPNYLSHLLWHHVDPGECDECQKRCFLKWCGGYFNRHECPKYQAIAVTAALIGGVT